MKFRDLLKLQVYKYFKWRNSILKTSGIRIKIYEVQVFNSRKENNTKTIILDLNTLKLNSIVLPVSNK